jgi:hypothetical protein
MPISIPAIFVFPRKSSAFNHFLDRPTWLPLALEARFWELAGTILSKGLSHNVNGRRVEAALDAFV